MDDFDLKPPEPPKRLMENTDKNKDKNIDENRDKNTESNLQPVLPDNKPDNQKAESSRNFALDSGKPELNAPKRKLFSRIFSKKQKQSGPLFEKVGFDEMATINTPIATINTPKYSGKDSTLYSDSTPGRLTHDLTNSIPDTKNSKDKSNAESAVWNAHPASKQATAQSETSVLSPPSIDSSNEKHKKELDELRKKLGIDEFTIPKPAPELKEGLRDENHENSYDRSKALEIIEEPLPELNHNVFEKTSQVKDIEEKGLMKTLADALNSDDSFTPFAKEPEKQVMQETPPAKNISDVSYPLFGMSGKVTKKHGKVQLSVEKIATSPWIQESADKDAADSVDWTAPDSLQSLKSGQSDIQEPQDRIEMQPFDIQISPEVTILSEDEIKDVVQATSSEGAVSPEGASISEYFQNLQKELKDIITAPFAYASIRRQKSKLQQKLSEIRSQKAKKGSDAYTGKMQMQEKILSNLKFLEEREKDDYNLPLFFRLYKETGIQSLIKLLKAIEMAYKIDLDEIIVKSKADFQDVLNRLIEFEKQRSSQELDSVKQELNAIAERALANAIDEVDKKVAQMEADFANLKQEQEQIQKDRAALEIDKTSCQKERGEIQSIIDKKLGELGQKFEHKEELLHNEMELRSKQLSKKEDEFRKLQKQQELDIFSEIQQVEKLKKEVEAKQFVLEDDRRAFEDEKDKFLSEKRQVRESLVVDIASLKEQKNALSQEIINEKTRLEGLEDDYNQRIRKEYSTKSMELDVKRKEFERYRLEQQKKLGTLIDHIHKEESELHDLKSELDAQEERIKILIDEQKQQIHKDLDEIRNIDGNLKKVEQNIIAQKEQLDREGFQKYIKARLSSIDPVAKAKELEAPNIDLEIHHEINSMIQECRSYLKQKDIDKAKEAYAMIDRKFREFVFNPKEKSLVFNLIRELYDDIHLLSLNMAAN